MVNSFSKTTIKPMHFMWHLCFIHIFLRSVRHGIFLCIGTVFVLFVFEYCNIRLFSFHVTRAHLLLLLRVEIVDPPNLKRNKYTNVDT